MAAFFVRTTSMSFVDEITRHIHGFTRCQQCTSAVHVTCVHVHVHVHAHVHTVNSICHEKYLILKFKPIVKAPRTYLLRSLQGWVLLLVLQVAFFKLRLREGSISFPTLAIFLRSSLVVM